MLSLDTRLKIPPHVISSKVAESAVLLNTKTKKYYALDDVGMRFWSELVGGQTFRGVYELLLAEYNVAPGQLEQDLLGLVNQLMDSGLVEINR